MQQAERAPDKVTIAAFVLVVFVGGANFIAVKYSNSELDPMFGASLRFAMASLLLLALAAAMKLPFPKGQALVGASLFGLLGFGASYAFLYVAITELSAGTTSVVMASVPLVTLFLAFFHKLERLHVRGILGGVLVIIGIGLVSTGISGDIPILYLLLNIAGVFCVAESTIVVKKFPRAHPMTTNAIAMAVGTLLLAGLSLLFRETWVLPALPATWAALGYLVVVGSIVLFMLFLFIIGRWTASASSYSITLFPIVAVGLGVWLAGESVTPMLLIGGAVVLSGVYLGAFGKRVAAPAAIPATATAATSDGVSEEELEPVSATRCS